MNIAFFTHKKSSVLYSLLDTFKNGKIYVVDFSKSRDLETACCAKGAYYIHWVSWNALKEEFNYMDLIISYKLPHIIPFDIIYGCRYGGVNIHPSLLPKYPGLNPWLEMYYNMDLEGGVTIHRLSEKPDFGNILLQESFRIGLGEPLNDAMAKAEEIAVMLLKQMLSQRLYTHAGKKQQLIRSKLIRITHEEIRKLPAIRRWHLFCGFPELELTFTALPNVYDEIGEYM